MCVCLFYVCSCVRTWSYANNMYIRNHMYACMCGGCVLPLPSPDYEREGMAVTTEKEKKT